MKRLVLSLSLMCFGVISQAQTPQKPDLVVGIVVDQMRWDYLHRFEPYFGSGGFKRMMREGYSFEENYIHYAPSVTAVGHASVYTGATPAFHGIVGNAWYERKDNDSKMYCVQDNSVQPIEGSEKRGKMSPKNLQAGTIGDELRLATRFQSRVFGIAAKDRGAILPAGRAANGAFWFDDVTGNMISSTYYYEQSPSWLTNFNKRNIADSLLKLKWEVSDVLKSVVGNSDPYASYKRDIDKAMAKQLPIQFQHNKADGYKVFNYLPYCNTMIERFAEQLISAERLGKNGVTDMLCVSFSATDYLGHYYGPQSWEVLDMYVRLDKEFERLFDFLDKQIGKGRYLVFLSADHAAPHTPAYMKDNKMAGGNVNMYETKWRDSLNVILEKEFQVPGIIHAYSEFQIYVSQAKLKERQLDKKKVCESIIRILNSMPEVLMAFTLEDANNLLIPTVALEMFKRGYHGERSGDIQIVMKPNFTEYAAKGTDHGTIFNYDTHLPMVWFGWKIPSGKSYRTTTISDIAPTLAALLQIQRPNASFGHVMYEIMEKAQP
jgi:predicted AlkP superfamily pyrophosphatase or phosphodiesterase